MIPSDHDTWGVSGPTFLLAYLVVAIAVIVAAVLTRRSLADAAAERPVTRMHERPYDVAYLNGGAQLAVTAALSAMYRAGTISTAGRGVVVAASRPDSRADELERAIHHAAASGPVSRHALPAVGGVASALHRLEQRLVAAGLLLTEQRRQRIRLTGGWVLAVVALGVVRIMAGYANARPVGYLTIAVVLVRHRAGRATGDVRIRLRVRRRVGWRVQRGQQLRRWRWRWLRWRRRLRWVSRRRCTVGGSASAGARPSPGRSTDWPDCGSAR